MLTSEDLWRVSIRTKRWNDAAEPDDGFRLLICRYRPRGVRKEGEPWDAWCIALSPSVELHADAYGKSGAEPIAWSEYEARFREEMKPHSYWLNGFAERVKRGEMLTLLCSSACIDETRCHRTIIREMLLEIATHESREAANPQRVIRRAR